MGGHAAGEVAAQLTVENVIQNVKRQRPLFERARRQDVDPATLAATLREAVQDACAEVYRVASNREGYAGMGCTLTMLVLAGHRAVMGHVGDTRLYLIRDGNIEQLSTDHTLAAELVRIGYLAPEDAKDHRGAHTLTRAVGTQPSVDVETLVFDVRAGDVFLLCSDGLSGYLNSPGELLPLMRDDFEAIPDDLVAFARRAGGEDNISAVAVRVDAEPKEAAALAELGADAKAKLDALSASFLFEHLTLAQALRLMHVCDVRPYETGDEIAREGDPGGTFYLVLEGRITVIRDGTARGELSDGDTAGETMLLDARPCRASLRATTPTRVLAIEGTRFHRFLRHRPWLGLTLLERLGRRAADSLDRANMALAAMNPEDTASPPGDLF